MFNHQNLAPTDRVRRLLREGNVPHKWGAVIVDSSSIKIERISVTKGSKL
jgi:hypothetical protein